MTKTAAPAASSSERKRFSNMGIRELYGIIGHRREHLRNNISNGVFKKYPHVLDGILYAYLTRKDELEEYRIEYALRPKKLALANATNRLEEVGPNGETSATHDFVTEKHKTGGKGQMVSAGMWVKRQSSSSLAC